MECEYCGKIILANEDTYRIVGIKKNSSDVRIFYYCEKCGRELVTEYRKTGAWIIEQS